MTTNYYCCYHRHRHYSVGLRSKVSLRSMSVIQRHAKGSQRVV